MTDIPDVDYNVTLTFTLDEEVDEYSGDIIFYFPAAALVDRGLNKDIRTISLVSQTVVLDLFRQEDLINISGIWQDDLVGDYDGLTSFERMDLLYLINRNQTLTGTLSWSSGSSSESLKCLVHTIDIDSEPGFGDIINYKIELLIIEVEI